MAWIKIGRRKDNFYYLKVLFYASGAFLVLRHLYNKRITECKFVLAHSKFTALCWVFLWGDFQDWVGKQWMMLTCFCPGTNRKTSSWQLMRSCWSTHFRFYLTWHSRNSQKLSPRYEISLLAHILSGIFQTFYHIKILVTEICILVYWDSVCAELICRQIRFLFWI